MGYHRILNGRGEIEVPRSFRKKFRIEKVTVHRRMSGRKKGMLESKMGLIAALIVRIWGSTSKGPLRAQQWWFLGTVVEWLSLTTNGKRERIRSVKNMGATGAGGHLEEEKKGTKRGGRGKKAKRHGRSIVSWLRSRKRPTAQKKEGDSAGRARPKLPSNEARLKSHLRGVQHYQRQKDGGSGKSRDRVTYVGKQMGTKRMDRMRMKSNKTI